MKSFAKNICKDFIKGNLEKMIESRSKDGHPVPEWFKKLIENKTGKGWIHCFGHLLKLDYDKLKKVTYSHSFEIVKS